MAHIIYPSSFMCDCGNQSDFSENTIRGMEVLSRSRRTPQVLGDSHEEPHRIIFRNGKAEAIVCPRLGRCTIVDDSVDDLDDDGSVCPKPTAAKFTAKQGRYLAFIARYMKKHWVAPAESDMLAHFQTTAPSVHQMVVTLERNGLISRTPGKARSIKILVPEDEIPDMDTGVAANQQPRLANLSAWLKQNDCTIALGLDPATRTCARAYRAGTLVCSGGKRADSLEILLDTLDAAVARLSSRS